MDGVITDNVTFHKRAWGAFCQKHGIAFSDELFHTLFFGKTNHQVLPVLFGNELNEIEIRRLSEEKETIYREIFKAEMKPVPGLVAFLEELHSTNIPAALATSAPPANVAFVLDGLNLRKYFRFILDDTMVIRGKPDPEIYLNATKLLNRKPSECIVFEDSLSGTKAAFDAGCKVVALTTTTKASEHRYYHHIVDDFRDISVNFILRLIL